MNNISDQFEFLWQEIQAEERRCKGIGKEEEDEEEELEEAILEELGASVSNLFIYFIYLFFSFNRLLGIHSSMLIILVYV